MPTPMYISTPFGTTTVGSRVTSNTRHPTGMSPGFGQVRQRLLPMRRVLRLVDHLFDLVLGRVDHLFDLVRRVADLLFGLTRATIGLAFGLEVLVAREASDRPLWLDLSPDHSLHPSCTTSSSWNLDARSAASTPLTMAGRRESRQRR